MKKLKKLSLKAINRLIRFNKNKINYTIIRNKNNIKNLSHLNIKSKKQ
jgi:hypothetical protein